MPASLQIQVSRADAALGRSDAILDAVRAALPEIPAESIQIHDQGAERDLVAESLSADQVKRTWTALEAADRRDPAAVSLGRRGGLAGGRKGGLADSSAQREARAKAKPGAGRPAAIVIGADRAGEYGIKVAGKRAWIINNRGGFGRGHLELGSEFCAESGHWAFLKAAAYLGWPDAEATWAKAVAGNG